MVAVGVCWRWQANDREDCIGRMAKASLVHGARLGGCELASLARISGRVESPILGRFGTTARSL